MSLSSFKKHSHKKDKTTKATSCGQCGYLDYSPDGRLLLCKNTAICELGTGVLCARHNKITKKIFNKLNNIKKGESSACTCSYKIVLPDGRWRPCSFPANCSIDSKTYCYYHARTKNLPHVENVITRIYDSSHELGCQFLSLDKYGELVRCKNRADFSTRWGYFCKEHVEVIRKKPHMAPKRPPSKYYAVCQYIEINDNGKNLFCTELGRYSLKYQGRTTILCAYHYTKTLAEGPEGSKYFDEASTDEDLDEDTYVKKMYTKPSLYPISILDGDYIRKMSQQALKIQPKPVDPDNAHTMGLFANYNKYLPFELLLHSKDNSYTREKLAKMPPDLLAHIIAKLPSENSSTCSGHFILTDTILGGDRNGIYFKATLSTKNPHKSYVAKIIPIGRKEAREHFEKEVKYREQNYVKRQDATLNNPNRALHIQHYKCGGEPGKEKYGVIINKLPRYSLATFIDLLAKVAATQPRDPSSLDEKSRELLSHAVDLITYQIVKQEDKGYIGKYTVHNTYVDLSPNRCGKLTTAEAPKLFDQHLVTYLGGYDTIREKDPKKEEEKKKKKNKEELSKFYAGVSHFKESLFNYLKKYKLSSRDIFIHPVDRRPGYYGIGNDCQVDENNINCILEVIDFTTYKDKLRGDVIESEELMKSMDTHSLLKRMKKRDTTSLKVFVNTHYPIMTGVYPSYARVYPCSLYTAHKASQLEIPSEMTHMIYLLPSTPMILKYIDGLKYLSLLRALPTIRFSQCKMELAGQTSNMIGYVLPLCETDLETYLRHLFKSGKFSKEELTEKVTTILSRLEELDKNITWGIQAAEDDIINSIILNPVPYTSLADLGVWFKDNRPMSQISFKHEGTIDFNDYKHAYITGNKWVKIKFRQFPLFLPHEPKEPDSSVDTSTKRNTIREIVNLYFSDLQAQVISFYTEFITTQSS